MMRQRLTAIFHGRVQGVGFRYNTHSIASRFAVVGTVRNCSDGTVELVAEGEKSQLLAFLSAIQERFIHNLDDTRVEWSVATDEFCSFEIKR